MQQTIRKRKIQVFLPKNVYAKIILFGLTNFNVHFYFDPENFLTAIFFEQNYVAFKHFNLKTHSMDHTHTFKVNKLLDS